MVLEVRNIVDSGLKKSFLWDHVVVKHLHSNVRVHLQGDEAAGEFADQLLAIGDGKYAIDTNPDIQLSENIGTFEHDVDELVARVYIQIYCQTLGICLGFLNDASWPLLLKPPTLLTVPLAPHLPPPASQPPIPY